MEKGDQNQNLKMSADEVVGVVAVAHLRGEWRDGSSSDRIAPANDNSLTTIPVDRRSRALRRKEESDAYHARVKQTKQEERKKKKAESDRIKVQKQAIK